MNKRVLILTLVLVALFALFRWQNGHASEDGNTWSPREVVLDDPSRVANLLPFQRSADGRVHILAYLATSPQLYSLVYTWRDGYGNWSDPEPIADFYASSSVNPVMAIDNDGSVHVVWWNEDLFSGNDALYYSERSPGGGWSAPLDLYPGGLIATWLGVTAIDNHIFVRWSGHDGIFLINRNPQGQWSAIEQINSGHDIPGSALHVLDAAENFHFIWDNDHQDDPSQRGVYHRSLSPAGVWGPIIRLSPEISDPDHYIGRVSADVDGNQVYVAWEQGNAENISSPLFTIYTAEWSGSGWSTPFPLTTPGDWSVRPPAVTNGYVGLTGIRWEPQPASHYLWIRPPGGVWTQETIGFANGTVRLANEANRLHFVWYSGGSPPMQYRWRDQAGNYSAIETIDSLNIDTLFLQSNHAHLDLAWQKDGNIYYSHAEPVGPFDHYLPAVIR